MLPRLGLFKVSRRNYVHIVLVKGNVYRPLCIRQPVVNGTLMGPDDKVTCQMCRTKGWINTLGNLTDNISPNFLGRTINKTMSELLKYES